METAYRVLVVGAAVADVRARAIQAQVVRGVRPIRGRGPVDAVGTLTVHGAAVAVAV